MKRIVLAAILLAVASPAAAQVKNWPVERPPRPLAARPVRFPPYEFRTLPNGLQVLAVSHHEQPVVSLRLIVRAGPAEDPDDKPGVASLAASLLDQGTTTKSAEQVANAIDSIGGALGTGAGSDLTYINAIVMKDSLNVGLDLVADLVQHPAFADQEIERQRQQLLSSLRVSYEDPEYLANIVFDRLVYGAHPYGRPQTGTPGTLAALTRDDLVAFHRKWFAANNAILAVVGDVTPEEAFAGAQRAFGTWARADLPSQAFPAPPPAARRIVVIDKPGAVQTEIRVGNLSIPRKNPDYTALDLAVKVLGGEGANRLHRVLRSERGLTYGASADLTGLQQSGDIAAQTNTRSSTTGETLRLLVDEVWKLTRDPVGDRELGGAQEYATGSFPLTIETPSQIAQQVLNAVFYGLDLNDLQNYRERVNAITPDDIRRVAKAYLHPDQLTIVLVGDASAFINQLPGDGFDRFDRIPASELDIFAPDLRRRAATAGGALRPVGFTTTTQQQDDAHALIQKAIAAKGGLAKLQGIRTVRAEATTTVQVGSQAYPLPLVTSIEYPSRFRVEAETPRGKVTQVYADGGFWIQDAQGVRDADAAARDVFKAGAERDTIPLLLKIASGELTIRTADADAPLAAVVVSGEGRPSTKIFINRDSGLIERVQYDSLDGLATEEYSDYRLVEGVRVAFHTTSRRPGAAPVERDIRKIHFNVSLPPGLFNRPS